MCKVTQAEFNRNPNEMRGVLFVTIKKNKKNFRFLLYFYESGIILPTKLVGDFSRSLFREHRTFTQITLI
jgi:hypothetical protein